MTLAHSSDGRTHNMKNSEVLAVINELILEEGGRELTLEDDVKDSGLDHFSSILLLLAIEEKFPIFDTTRIDPQIKSCLDCSVRELVHRCRLSIKEQ